MATNVQTVDVMDRVWRTPAGILGYLSAVNHRTVGARYIATGLFFLGLAGLAALVMRIQLAIPNAQIINPELYNQLMTLHGATMMFLFSVPIMEGIGIYFVPLMIGSRDMAFPRLNAFGYFVYLISGLTLWLSLLFNQAPDGGWFNYVPLTDIRFSPDLGIDLWATMITFLEIAALVAAVEIIASIFFTRAPGMSINRIPLFVWAQLVMAFMIVFAMPPLVVGSVELALDRTVGTHFFRAEAGGDPLLWQHLFWFFGHPEVYIIFVPALGVVATVVATFARRPIIGYVPLVLSLVAIGFFSFGLWVHHMYSVGLPTLGLSFFTVASFAIAVPSGIQIFASLATMYYGRVIMNTSMLFIVGFIITFVLGGITGVMVASVPFDWQVHDTYFVVAHFHYVLIGGAVFPLLAGFFYWFPKITGRFLDETLGRWQFWLVFIGFHITFFTMHITGFLGMPRRVYTFLPGLGWEIPNLISTIGAFILATGFLIFFINIFKSLQAGELAGDNPWGAGTLEWATTSPPQNFNFALVPEVNSRYPLWEDPLRDRTVELKRGREGQATDRYGLLADRRETIGTSLLDAKPQQRVHLPGPSLVPLFAALTVGLTFIGLVIDIIFVPIGALLFFITAVIWHWPNEQQRDMDYVKAADPDALPSSTIASSRGVKPPFYWGLALLVLIETVVFGSLVVSYFYLRSSNVAWPLGGIDPPDLLLPTINAFILWGSSIPMYLADKGIQKGNQRRLRIGLVIGISMAIVFLVLKYIEYSQLGYNWGTNAYGSIVWTITGFHSAHVIALVLKTIVIARLAFMGYFNEERHAAIDANGLYWHFVVIIWLPLYLTLYIAPRIL